MTGKRKKHILNFNSRFCAIRHIKYQNHIINHRYDQVIFPIVNQSSIMVMDQSISLQTLRLMNI
jgi:hypothetical protein